MENIFSDALPSSPMELKTNEYLFRIGDRIRFLYYIEKGSIKLERITKEGKEVITAFYRTNNYVAEASLFNETYHCRAISTGNSILSRYPKNQILTLFAEEPYLAVDYSSILARGIRSLREQLEFINILDAEERLLNFISSRCKDNVFQIPGSLKNLAAQIGLTHETLYRKLNVLSKKGIIEKSEKTILVKYDV